MDMENSVHISKMACTWLARSCTYLSVMRSAYLIWIIQLRLDKRKLAKLLSVLFDQRSFDY